MKTCRGSYILAIDPGTKKSGYAVLDACLKPVMFGKTDNEEIPGMAAELVKHINAEKIAGCCEMVESYGMPVGREVFETCVWIGRFIERLNDLGIYGYDGDGLTLIYRKEEKLNLCNSVRANDATIRQALIDRFGPVGTKKNPGWFYGVHRDAWTAIAVGVTFSDLYLTGIGR